MNAPDHNDDEFTREEITPEEIEAAQLTAYALGQLQGEGRAEVERKLSADAASANQREISEMKALASAVSLARTSAALPQTDAALRDRIEKQLTARASDEPTAKVAIAKQDNWWRWPSVLEWCVIGGVCSVLAALFMPAVQGARESSRRMQAANAVKQLERAYDSVAIEHGYGEIKDETTPEIQRVAPEDPLAYAGRFQRSVHESENGSLASEPGRGLYQRMMSRNDKLPPGDLDRAPAGPDGLSGATNQFQNPLATATQDTDGSARKKKSKLTKMSEGERLPAVSQAANGVEAEYATTDVTRKGEASRWRSLKDEQKYDPTRQNAEQYAPITENPFLSPLQQPLSTFSIDVDTASYANMRRFLTSGRLPPRNSVRIEELVNYFRYEYPQPKGSEPFSVNMEVAECPWAPGTLTPALSQGERETKRGHLLLRVGLKGKEVQRTERPASNLVFLLDVSGSMADENKLPLLKTAMKMLIGELGENDRVSIVTYAGDAGLKLKSTRGNQQQRITRAIDSLSAGGSTNGSAGIELAYEQATANFITGGANRVILCTDGDLNVGITSDEALTKLIKQKAKSGVFLTVLGFGEGNLKDAKMEKLADNGNGLYAYIDSVREARKVLVEQLTGSTITIAKDVKIQIEFNPAQIAAYRLLGYENRVLAAEDFNNDKKDAGEIGAGHMVTALYELVPVGGELETAAQRPATDPLKYQQPGGNLLPETRRSSVNPDAPGPGLAPANGELLTLKLRYKEPEGETSKLLEYPLKDRGHSFHSASPDLRFAAAVASFGMILRNSQHRGSATLEGVAEIASGALGKDEGGYRAEFVDLVRKAQALGAR
jgi:Mg-chelatase subunit ChlD